MTYASALLVTLAQNGSKDDLVFEKVYRVLTKYPYSWFNPEIVVYKHVNSAALGT